MVYYATPYTIHFDDTMAYGSHHFLTSFKFQCEGRESLIFGDRVFDVPAVRDAIAGIHLFTSDAYSRNLSPAKLGDRVAILMTIEDLGRISVRFCFRVIGQHGQPVCAGFQTIVIADAKTGIPKTVPEPLRQAFDTQLILEPGSEKTFRDRVLAGGRSTESLFSSEACETGRLYLTNRYPRPDVISLDSVRSTAAGEDESVCSDESAMSAACNVDESSDRASATSMLVHQRETRSAWVFSGQGSAEPELLSQRIAAYESCFDTGRKTLDQCAAIAAELVGGDASAIVGSVAKHCSAAMKQTPALAQVATFLQNVLAAELEKSVGHAPTLYIGQSFGETAALSAAGWFDIPTGVRIVCQRTQAIAEHAPPGGGLVAVAASRAKVLTESSLLGLDQVVIAGRNHDGQTIASGPVEQLDILRHHFKRFDTSAVRIPSPTSFHHPCLRRAAQAWRELLEQIEVFPPSGLVYSAIGRRFIDSTCDLPTVLASQLLRPFDLQGAMADLADEGITQFIDCGTSGRLQRLLQAAAPEGTKVTDLRPATPPSAPAADTSASSTPSPLNPTSSSPSPNPNFLTPTAIVAEGCVLPGGVTSPSKLGQVLADGQSGIVDLREIDPYWEEDFYSETLVSDRSTSALAGLVRDEDLVPPADVDAAVFAQFTRAQKMLCLSLIPCSHALHGAKRVVCFVGSTADGYEDQDYTMSLQAAGLDLRDQAIAPRIGRQPIILPPHDAIQEVFDKIVASGLKVTLVDAACASSLYAVGLGARALESRDADAVIAGGVFCPGHGNSCLFSQFRGLTPTGLRPFDAAADGVVFSEGAAFVVLRRLEDAQQRGLPVSALIRGVGLSSDGRSPSANVPQTKGQLLAVERCYADYDIDPSSVTAIEGHGTSTPVGDATELRTLQTFFAGKTDGRSLPVHSLKGLLGHTGWAAGTASIIAACEYMRRGVVPAQAGHTQPSDALQQAVDVLRVPTEPVSLEGDRQCFAINGFGFGGSNAHVVVESYVPNKTTGSFAPATQFGLDHPAAVSAEPPASQELVIVGQHVIRPPEAPADIKAASSPARFDRQRLELPHDVILLPDLADDLDISQALSLAVVSETLANVDGYQEDHRCETGLVLAMAGRTQRGVEAIFRIMRARFQRDLSEHSALKAIEDTYAQTRPSGPYTLQCMMPNVSAGRAALQFDLNGPNFVVDDGRGSWDAALTSAELILRGGDASGTKIVLVSGINTNPNHTLQSARTSALEPEYAAAFAVTTRQHATELGLGVICGIKRSTETSAAAGETSSDQVHALVGAFRQAQAGISTSIDLGGSSAWRIVPNMSPDESTSIENRVAGEAQRSNRSREREVADKKHVANNGTEFPVHVPVWVDSAAEFGMPVRPLESVLVVAPANAELIRELLFHLPSYSTQQLIVVAGSLAQPVVQDVDDPRVMIAELENEELAGQALGKINRFPADMILAVEQVTSWQLHESVAQVANHNDVAEATFLIARQSIAQLRQGDVELWGLFPGAWNGVVHACTGAVSGLVKAIKRELPSMRAGLVSTSVEPLHESLERLFAERSAHGSASESLDEVAFAGNRRQVRRLRPANVDDARDSSEKHPSLTPDSVVIATGGARGVTAVLLDAILRDYQCTVIALGRSPLQGGPADPHDPEVEREFYARFVAQYATSTTDSSVPPDLRQLRRNFETLRAQWEAHNTIEQLSQLGGRVQYVPVDVTDAEQVERVIADVVSEYGRVDLIVHGAGVQWSKRLEDRSLSEFRKTYDVKVGGLLNLLRGCEQQLGHTVSTHVLTSAYSIFGNDGQHDYGAANETLDRLCGQTEILPDHWSSIAWLAWDGIGMTRGSEYQTLAKARGLSGLRFDDGQQVFRSVFAGDTNSTIHLPLTAFEQNRYRVHTIPAAWPNATGRVCELPVVLREVGCLDHHHVSGVPTLPGAWSLNFMVNAALQLVDRDFITTVALEDTRFNRFVRLANGQNPRLRVIAEERTDGIHVWMVGDVLHPSGTLLVKDALFGETDVRFDFETPTSSLWQAAPANRRPAENEPTDFYRSNTYMADPYISDDLSEVELSGPFDCLRRIQIGAWGREAVFAVDEELRLPGSIPALLIDASWRLGAMYANGEDDELYIPVHCQRIVTPVGISCDSALADGWSLRATAPLTNDRSVLSGRTEVFDDDGKLRLLIEKANAVKMQSSTRSRVEDVGCEGTRTRGQAAGVEM